MAQRDSTKKQSLSLKGIIFIVVMAGVGILIGYLLGSYFGSDEEGSEGGPTLVGKLTVLALVPVSYYLVILLHELGHLLLGLSQKFTFAYLMVGPVIFRKVENTFRFQRNRGFNLLGGFTVMLFPQEGNLRKRMIPYVAGGPLATLITGVLGVWLFLDYGGMSALKSADALLDTIVLGFSGLFTVFSVFVLFISLLPRRAGIVQTDGARLLSLMSASDDEQPEFLYYAQYQSSYGGTHPRDYDRSRLEKVLAAGEDSSFTPFAHLSLYLMEVAAENFAEAERHLVLARDGVADQNPFISQIVEYEYAFFQALWGGADAYSEDLWPEKQRTILEPGTKARFLVAQYWRRGEYEKAQEQLVVAKKSTPHHLDQGFAKIEMDWLGLLEERILAAKA